MDPIKLLDDLTSATVAAHQRPGFFDQRLRRAEVLLPTAELVIAIDPDRAMGFARALPVADHRHAALAVMAAELVGTDPGRANTLFADVEHNATSWSARTAVGVVRMAVALHRTDRRRAERLLRQAEARLLADTPAQTACFAGEFATALAVLDRRRAEKALDKAATRPLSPEEMGDDTWAAGSEQRLMVAVAMVAYSPRKAEQILARVHAPYDRDCLRPRLIKAIAAVDLAHAERLARATTNAYHRVVWLGETAEISARREPARADRLIREARGMAEAMTDGTQYRWSMSAALKAVAVREPERADRLATSIGDVWLSGSLAGAIAATNPARGLELARSVPDKEMRTRLLAEAAQEIAAVDPALAEDVVREGLPSWEVADVLLRMVPVDPDRAARLARKVGHHPPRASVFVALLSTMRG
ncbi:hypothetical protein [Allokutzneria sp. NRRL B-24872]|uniref:hypothetical protein n=1 Tax=Allokutzneria sp. NRRL B-24872 TaxID=1137961 RepID=UPI0011781C02|nr:hypothetical protein [Allokutzneria sp. NRRL B-24872]